MVIYGVYVVAKSGGLIFNYDHYIPKIENTVTFQYPINIKLTLENNRVVVSFGQRDGIMVGHVLTAINDSPITNNQLADGSDVLELLSKPENFPVRLTFARPKMTTNDKLFLASMFYPLFAFATQLSPEPRSSGIEVLEADTFKLLCYQTLTGVKFMIVGDTNQSGMDLILKKMYELYADYALKNPFYALEMPIRCELFDTHLQNLLQQHEKTGVTNV